MRLTIFLAVCLAAMGCSRSPSDDPAPPPPTASQPNALRIDPMTALPQGRLMHLTSSEHGIFFVQETEAGHDDVLQVDDLDSLSDTPLNSGAVAAAMGFPKANGNFEGLAASGDYLYFYFVASVDAHFHAAVGRYSLRSREIEILAREPQLASTSGAGDGLSICRGEMVCSQNILWLWLHSLDGNYFLQFNTQSKGDGLRRPFDKLVTDFVTPELNHEAYRVGAGAGGSMLIVDAWTHALWEIGPGGVVYLRVSLIDMPGNISAPTLDDKNRIVIFVPSSEKNLPRFDWQKPQGIPAQYPALLGIAETDSRNFSQPALIAPAQFPASKLQITALCPTPDGKGWIGFDPNVSELFRMTPVKK